MRRIILLVSVAIVASMFLPLGISYTQSTTNSSAASDLERPLHRYEMQVASWRSVEILEIMCILLAGTLGVIIAALQKSSKGIAKKITVVLGILSAVLAVVNSTVFPADVKTLRRAVFDGSAVIDQLWIKVRAAENQELSPQDRKTATDDYVQALNQFKAVGDTLTGTSITKASTTTFPGFPLVVHAQSVETLPAWTRQAPSDTATAMYFVGKSTAPSLTLAKQNASDAALYNAALALVPIAPNVSRSALLDLIRTSSVMMDSAFAYDNRTGNYDYYTLVRLSPDIKDIVKSLPGTNTPALVKFERKGWQPSDLTSNASGLFALDSSGSVSKLEPAQSGSGAIEKLFQIARSEAGYALAASTDFVFAVTGSNLGCKVYRYSLTTKAVTSRLLAVKERCVGIATDGTAMYVTMPERKEIRYWDTWEASDGRSWSISELSAPGYITFDRVGHRLIVADDVSGAAFAVSIPDGRTQFLARDLGAVQSIAVSRFHILFASGKKVLFVARSDNHGENPPPDWPALPGGHLVGVVIDSSEEVWVADYDHRIVTGPLPLI